LADLLPLSCRGLAAHGGQFPVDRALEDLFPESKFYSNPADIQPVFAYGFTLLGRTLQQRDWVTLYPVASKLVRHSAPCRVRADAAH
jgi:hypothetical protein